jgi:hypothetical protein
VDDDDVRFAAGMTRLIAYAPGSGKARRWNLLTGKLEKEGPLAPHGQVRSFCMGSASDGPLLVSGDQATTLVDVETFEPLEMPTLDRDPNRRASLQEGIYWASADGRTFGKTGFNGMPNGVVSVLLEGGKIRGYSQHIGTSYVVPGPDGGLIYTGGHGVVSRQIKETKDAVPSSAQGSGTCDGYCLPAHSGPYYLHLHLKLRLGPPLNADDPEQGATVYLPGMRTPLAQLKLPEMPTWGDLGALGEIGFERSVHLIPEAHLLVVLPTARDKLLLVPFDPEAALEKTGAKYLLVTSHPPGEARRGQAFEYAIKAKAKAGPATFKLESGPPGMTATARGLLRWDVPADFADKEAAVIVSVRDADGQQVFHSFTLAVRAKPADEAEGRR